MAEFDFATELAAARQTFQTISDALNPEKLKARVAELSQQAAAPDLWNDQDHAQEVTYQLNPRPARPRPGRPRFGEASQRRLGTNSPRPR